MQNTKHYFDYERTLVDIKPGSNLSKFVRPLSKQLCQKIVKCLQDREKAL